MAFPVSTLLGQIEVGQIGLPALQRPFVWDRVQVRDLLDSLYRGYPAGFFLLWQTSSDVGALHIGADGKQADPGLLVVDGQQRLTSLHAVLRGQPVYTEKFDEVRIRIAFHPIKEKFEVANSATAKDPEWVSDISPLLSGQVTSYSFVNDFIAQLEGLEPLSPELREQIATNLQRLYGLNNYPFTAIQLSFDLPIEEIAEIFVRVNSKGTQLDQADFILTLMSVHRDKDRKELEEFCRLAKAPSKGPGPFNWFIQPLPDQLLRVAVGLGHRRAKLKYAYELLRGRDLETGEMSPEIRESNFEKLHAAQEQVLDLTNFSEYLKAVQDAGFRSGKMITSKNTIVYCYLVFLLGRVDHSIDYIKLRRAIARWFMMCVLTSRYTGSPESQVEKDIRRLAEAIDGEQFLATIDQIIAANLTNDFWDMVLPESLQWSGGYVPAMFAYYASLNLLGAKVLFSSQSVHQLLDPALVAKRSSIERHHLFPRNYLKSIGIERTVQTNRIANYALVEWPDNAEIGDKAPAEYFPSLFNERVPVDEQEQVRFWHALPEGWEIMPYETFLAHRQKLIAQVIRAGYEKLSGAAPHPTQGAVREHLPTVQELVEEGESISVEFKSSLAHSYVPEIPEKVIVGNVIKSLAAFLNSDGGTLVIGISDTGEVLGVEPDLKLKGFNLDQYENFLHTTIVRDIDPVSAARCRVRFEGVEGRTLCLVDVPRSSRPVYATTDKGRGLFFVRTGNSTRALETKEAVIYVADRFAMSS
jgi:hypothetical protein